MAGSNCTRAASVGLMPACCLFNCVWQRVTRQQWHRNCRGTRPSVQSCAIGGEGSASKRKGPGHGRHPRAPKETRTKIAAFCMAPWFAFGPLGSRTPSKRRRMRRATCVTKNKQTPGSMAHETRNARGRWQTKLAQTGKKGKSGTRRQPGKTRVVAKRQTFHKRQTRMRLRHEKGGTGTLNVWTP